MFNIIPKCPCYDLKIFHKSILGFNANYKINIYTHTHMYMYLYILYVHICVHIYDELVVSHGDCGLAASACGLSISAPTDLGLQRRPYVPAPRAQHGLSSSPTSY